MLRSLSRKLISCSIGRAYVPASWGRLIGCYIPFLPSLTLSCSNSSDGISWASSIPDWHWLIDMSLYWSLWKKPPAKTKIKKIYTALTKLNCILQPFHVWKVMGISHMYDNSIIIRDSKHFLSNSPIHQCLSLLMELAQYPRDDKICEYSQK